MAVVVVVVVVVRGCGWEGRRAAAEGGEGVTGKSMGAFELICSMTAALFPLYRLMSSVTSSLVTGNPSSSSVN